MIGKILSLITCYVEAQNLLSIYLELIKLKSFVNVTNNSIKEEKILAHYFTKIAAISTPTNAILSSTLVIVINQLRERITLLKKNMYQIMDKLNDLMIPLKQFYLKNKSFSIDLSSHYTSSIFPLYEKVTVIYKIQYIISEELDKLQQLRKSLDPDIIKIDEAVFNLLENKEINNILEAIKGISIEKAIHAVHTSVQTGNADDVDISSGINASSVKKRKYSDGEEENGVMQFDNSSDKCEESVSVKCRESPFNGNRECNRNNNNDDLRNDISAVEGYAKSIFQYCTEVGSGEQDITMDRDNILAHHTTSYSIHTAYPIDSYIKNISNMIAASVGVGNNNEGSLDTVSCVGASTDMQQSSDSNVINDDMAKCNDSCHSIQCQQRDEAVLDESFDNNSICNMEYKNSIHNRIEIASNVLEINKDNSAYHPSGHSTQSTEVDDISSNLQVNYNHMTPHVSQNDIQEHGTGDTINSMDVENNNILSKSNSFNNVELPKKLCVAPSFGSADMSSSPELCAPSRSKTC